MKAIYCREFGAPSDVARVETIDEPKPPGLGEVQIDIDYASVSHSSDLLIRGKYQIKPPLPFIPGTELVGTIRLCGDDVTGFKPGDRVVALARWGCFAESITMPITTVYGLDPTLAALKALPLPISYGTAYLALFDKISLKPSDTVLVLGAGSGVGLAAVELAASAGATVLACASSPQKRQLAEISGAHTTFEPTENIAQSVKQQYPHGVNIIFDPVGGSLMEQSFRALAQGGQILSIGFASGTLPALPPNIMLVKNLSLHGFFYGRYIGWTPDDASRQHEHTVRQMMRTLQRLALENKIKPNVTRTYPLKDLPIAIDDLHTRRVVGKVALAIRESPDPSV